jgi:hypothetical protein
MSNAVPTQHPAVVLRSRYTHLQALLAIAAIVVVSLTIAVVVLATNDERSTTVSPATPASTLSPSSVQQDTTGPTPIGGARP